MEKLLVSVIGMGLIGGIYWFFFGKKEEVTKAATSWNILVKGGYQPATITVPNGKTSTLTFTRKDQNSCLEDVIMEDFKVKQFLPMNTPITITISPSRPGTYGIHCGMNMFHGKIIVI